MSVGMVDALMVAENEKYRLRILQDEDAVDPTKEFDMLGTMVFWHRRYKLGHEHRYDSPREFFEALAEEFGVDPERCKQWSYAKLQEFVEDRIIRLDVYIYDHSGITIQASESGNPFHCLWDSGWLGYIYVTKKRAREEYGRLTKKRIELIKGVLRSEIELYDHYLTGNVYGFILEEKIKKPCLNPSDCEDGCTCWDEDDQYEYKEIDSCWGFYGDPDKSGMEDHLPEDARGLIKELKWVG